MKIILLALALWLALAIPAFAQPSLCTISGTLLKPTGGTCAGCSFSITKSKKGGIVLSSTSVAVPSDSGGVVSFTAVRGAIITITGNFILGTYNFTNGIDLYVPDTATATMEGLRSTSDLLDSLVNGGTAFSSVVFASLGTPSVPIIVYCSNCQVTSGADNTCATGGSGAFAFRIGSSWKCFALQN